MLLISRHETIPPTLKITSTKRTSVVKPTSPFKKKKLFVDTNKVQERKGICMLFAFKNHLLFFISQKRGHHLIRRLDTTVKDLE